MSKIILGTVQFGLDYGINNRNGKIKIEEIFKILDFGFNNGVSFLDTAEAYGNAHEIIGKYHRASINKFNVVTKYSNARKDLPRNIFDRVSKILLNLSVNNLYCYMFHNYNDYKTYYKLFEKDLQKLKSKGLIKKIGVSLHSNEELKNVLKNDNISLIQLPFNLLDNSNHREEILLKAKSKGVEIHTRSVFLQGLFFKNSSELKGYFNEFIYYIDSINSMVSKDDINGLAINYVNSKKYIDHILIGVDNLSHFKENIKILNDNKFYNLYKLVDSFNFKNVDMLNPSNWKK